MDAHIRFRFDTLSVEEQERIRKKHEEQKAMQDILRSQIEEREKYKKNHREDGGRGARAERLNIPQPVEVPSTAETGYAPQNEGGGGGGGFMLPRTQVRAANRDQHQAAFGRGGLEVKVGGEVETTAHDYPPWLNNHDYTDGPSPIKALPVPHTDGGGQQDHADFTRYRLDRMTAEERDTHVKRMEERKRMQEMLAQQVEEKKRKREMEKQRQKQEEEEEDRRIQEYLQRKGAQMHKDKRQVIANVGGNVAKESSVPVDEQAEAKPYAGRDFGPDVARPPLPVPTQVQPQPRHEGDHRGPAAVPGIDALPHAPPPARHPVNLGGNEYRDEDLMGLPKVVSARNQEVESAIVAGLEAEYEDERAQRVLEKQKISGRRGSHVHQHLNPEEEVDRVMRELDGDTNLANILGKARATKVQAREEGSQAGKAFFQKHNNDSSHHGEVQKDRGGSSSKRGAASRRPPLSTRETSSTSSRDARGARGPRAQSANVERTLNAKIPANNGPFARLAAPKGTGRNSAMSSKEAMKKSLSADSLFVGLRDNPFGGFGGEDDSNDDDSWIATKRGIRQYSSARVRGQKSTVRTNLQSDKKAAVKKSDPHQGTARASTLQKSMEMECDSKFVENVEDVFGRAFSAPSPVPSSEVLQTSPEKNGKERTAEGDSLSQFMKGAKV